MREGSFGTAFESAQENLSRREKSLEAAQNAYLDAQSETPIFDAIDYGVQKWLTGKADKKLEQLKRRGGAEAAVTELNQEYERLKANAEQSILALKNFERTKLGATDENELEA